VGMCARLRARLHAMPCLQGKQRVGHPESREPEGGSCCRLPVSLNNLIMRVTLADLARPRGTTCPKWEQSSETINSCGYFLATHARYRNTNGGGHDRHHEAGEIPILHYQSRFESVVIVITGPKWILSR
jgi:hypothetical protein